MFEPIDKSAVDMQRAFEPVARRDALKDVVEFAFGSVGECVSRPSLQAVPEPFFQPLHGGWSVRDEPVFDVLHRRVNQPLEVLFGALFQFGGELLFFVGGEPLVEPLFEQAVVFSSFK